MKGIPCGGTSASCGRGGTRRGSTWYAGTTARRCGSPWMTACRTWSWGVSDEGQMVTDRAEELSLSAQQARAFVLEGIEDELAGLRRFDTRNRLLELAFFPSLWVAAAGLTLLARIEMEVGWARTAFSVLGVLVSAIAINA